MLASKERNNTEMKPIERELVITRMFDAPPGLVFHAWIDPAHLVHWWGPKVFTNPVCQVDARVGGAWRIVMRSPDGVEFTCQGVYREIVPPTRLVFTNQALDSAGTLLIDGVVTVTFAEHLGQTKLTLEIRAVGMVAIAAQMLEYMEAGWTSSLDALRDELAGVPGKSACTGNC